jgi:hypothetical protein
MIEVELRWPRRDIGMRVINAEDLQTASVGVALNFQVDQWIDEVPVAGAVGALVIGRHNLRYHAVFAEHDTAHLVWITGFEVSVDLVQESSGYLHSIL